VIAAVGLVASAADGLRRLPHVLGSAGQAAARRYDELALRGEEVLAGHPHPRADQTGASAPPDPATAPSRAAAAPATAGGRSAAVAASGTAAEPPVGRPEVERAVGGTGALEPPIGRTEPVVLPDHVQAEVARLTPGADLAHDELPMADFDHQTLPQLRGRLRTLSLAELVQLRDYEQAHAARLPVLTLLDNRIAKLLADTDR
jgi:hypothetical protein